MTERPAPTLTVLHEGTPIFTSSSNWLYPLLELEAYLANYPVSPTHLFLEDKIIGKYLDNVTLNECSMTPRWIS